MHNVLLCERKLSAPKEKIVSPGGSEKVLQPSSKEMTFEPNTRGIILASTKRGVSWGSEKRLLPKAIIYVNGLLGRLRLRCIFDSSSENSFLTLRAAERLNKIKTYFTIQDHMEEITNIDDITSEEGFFLPHHGALRAKSCSRPLRVVFKGSQKTDLDILLNDVLCEGGDIQ
ncbi:hypothetical protein TNCV_3108131 [Trichonephila clavipes]|uniref:Uncharacterized protein n=1 Tax=Trichonephila clavipes TaxID=2585209 RepID=A0A8X6S3G7_TRICX|nr:hypothetical protein TNCV_3108131 [Trichonephila clavipes]